MKRLRQIPMNRDRMDLQSALNHAYSRIDRLPSTLTLKGKSDFQLGYFHQSAVVVRGRKTSRYRAADQETIVKSHGERMIADWLFGQEINFAYEKPIDVPDKISDPEGGQKQVEPDFTLEREPYALIIEYTGMLDSTRYLRTWRWKYRRLTKGIGGVDFGRPGSRGRKPRCSSGQASQDHHHAGASRRPQFLGLF